MDDAAQNRLLFREVNERIRETFAAQGDGGSPEFMCECGRDGCATLIQLSLADYERIREADSRYLVLPEHRDSEAQVFEEHEGWLVVTVADSPA